MRGTKVSVAICESCGYGVYSVARHDFRPCPCGQIYVDGGFDYMRIGGPDSGRMPRIISVTVRVSKKELVKDYAHSTEEFRAYGCLSRDQVWKICGGGLKKNISLLASKSRSKKKATNRKVG